MGWLEDLSGQVVAIDTAPLIYFIEQRAPYIDALRPFFQAADRGDFRVIASSLVLLEVLVHPIRRGDEALAHKYNDILLSAKNIETLPVLPLTAQAAAELRADSNLKTPDAIHLATALTNGATAFLTNDRDFGEVPDLRIMAVSELLND